MYWQMRQKRRMGLEVAEFQYKNLLRMVSKGKGINPGPRVTRARQTSLLVTNTIGIFNYQRITCFYMHTPYR